VRGYAQPSGKLHAEMRILPFDEESQRLETKEAVLWSCNGILAGLSSLLVFDFSFRNRLFSHAREERGGLK
jgi:hypothetical protein